jgi:O-antigen ligase
MMRASTWLALTAGGAVLAFGATGALTVALVECIVAAIFLNQFWSSQRPTFPRMVWAAVLPLALWPLLQIVPLPPAVWQMLAPERATSYLQVLGPWNLAAGSFALSVQTQATLETSLRLLCYLQVFLLAVHWERQRLANPLVIFLVVISLFEAVYGLVQYLTGFQYIFTVPKVFYTGDATGTYINRCKFAGLLQMALPFLLAGILFPRPSAPLLRSLNARPASDDAFGTLARVTAFAVVLLGLVFSRCRMGMISIAVALLVVVTAALLRRGRRAWLPLLAVLALPLTYALWVGISPVSERFEQLDPHVGEQGRVELWQDALRAIRANPWFGTGLGTYNTISTRYQTYQFQYHIDHAHNDYLEYAAELGVPIALLLFGSLWWLTIRLAGSLRGLSRRSDLVLASGCCGAILSLLLHSLTDFNLAIPANALVLAWVCGTGAGLLARVRENPT